MQTRFTTFESFHGKQNIGSTNIRVHQLLKYWPEAGIYKFGENPDVLVFQKVYVTPDYRFPEHFKRKKILDVCDADHLNGVTSIKETIDCMDAVTCPTETLATFFRQLTDKPVVVIPDRFDLDLFPEPKQHDGPAQTVAWFGYRHNAELLRPAMNLINELNLNLLVIADDDPMAWQWLSNRQESNDFRTSRYRYIKYSADQAEFHRDLQQADFVVLPEGTRPVDYFKSNNKTTRSILCGLPVAKTADDIRRLLYKDARIADIDEHYQATRVGYDCRKSVEQYKNLIDKL